MAVDTFDPQQFDPSRQSQSLDAGLVADALHAARDQVSGAPEVSLSAEQVSGLAALVVHAGWSAAAADLPADDVTALIRLFTLGESQFSSWQAGSKSAVIKLVRVLKQRGEMPAELNAWIRANTSNRFLPHGDLMDRL